MNAAPIPVTLLTGFLGSGKSTLLNQILREPHFSDTAVVVNEFGDVGLDDFLVEHSTEHLIEMTSGCLCCTIRGDIRETLLDLHGRRQRGEIPAFTRLIVETTGLADPAPVIHTLMTEPRFTGRFMLGGIVATVDAVNGEATLERHDECVKQIAVADRLVLTKTDLVKDPAMASDLERLKQKIGRKNPGAPVLERNDGAFDLRKLFDTSLYDPATKDTDVQRWLNAEAYEHDDHHHHDHHHHDNDNAHDVNRHGADIRSFSLVFSEPVSSSVFNFALEVLAANRGEDLLRVKGVVYLAEEPDTPIIIHGVQHVFHPVIRLDAWPTSERQTKLVFITRGIPKKTVETLFRAWQYDDNPPAPDPKATSL